VVRNLPIPDVIKDKDYALGEAARPFLGVRGFKIIAIAALFSTFSAINAILYGCSSASYMIAKRGSSQRCSKEKCGEGAGRASSSPLVLVVLITNLFDLGGIALLGSGSFLLVYAVANVAHLNLCEETGTNPPWIWLSIVGCLFSPGVLVVYEVLNSPVAALVLGGGSGPVIPG